MATKTEINKATEGLPMKPEICPMVFSFKEVN